MASRDVVDKPSCWLQWPGILILLQQMNKYGMVSTSSISQLTEVDIQIWNSLSNHNSYNIEQFSSTWTQFGRTMLSTTFGNKQDILITCQKIMNNMTDFANLKIISIIQINSPNDLVNLLKLIGM